jgi:OOP family OmpA-OmpF porin
MSNPLERSAEEETGIPRVADGSGREAEQRLHQLRELILGREVAQIAALRRRLDDPKLRSKELSASIAEAIALRAKQDHKLQTTLQPLIEEALRISVARDPAMLATSLFPIIGESVRKAVAHALQGMFDSLNLMLDRGLSLESWRWRFEAWRTGRSFGEVALTHSLSYRVEQVFLIHRETGLLLGHLSFSDGVVQDADLISGMLTAIQDFVRDSFGRMKQDELEVMEVGEFKLWLQHGPLVLLAAVVSGQPPRELRQVFERELEAIHAEFGPALQAYDGDSSSIEGAKANLRRCLLGGEKARVEKSYKAVWAVFLLILLAVGGIVALRIRDDRRWASYVGRLRSEPGIVVIQERHRWRSYSVSGLRDPFAVDPASLLAASLVPASSVSEHWEPYLSLDPSFDGMRGLEAGKERVERQRIHFDLDSAQLPVSQFDVLDAVEEDVNTLRRIAAANRVEVRIAIYGHTDRTGKEDRNEELSRARANTVKTLLAKHGIPEDMLSASGVAASIPGHPEAETYPQELDRRVTFKVTLIRNAPSSEARQ